MVLARKADAFGYQFQLIHLCSLSHFRATEACALRLHELRVVRSLRDMLAPSCGRNRPPYGRNMLAPS